MKRKDTINTLNNILQRKQKDLEGLQATIEGLRIAIREVETTEVEFVTTPQKGSFRETMTDAMYAALKERGPLHRSIILAEILDRGIHVGGGINTVSAYLSVDERFKNVSRGVWAAADSAEESVPVSLNGHMSLE